MLRNRDLNIEQQEQVIGGKIVKNGGNGKATTADEPALKKRAASIVPKNNLETTLLKPTLDGSIDTENKTSPTTTETLPKQRTTAIIVKSPQPPQHSINDENCPEVVESPHRESFAAVEAPQILNGYKFEFDHEKAGDLLAVSEYAHEIFQYYKAREPLFKVHDYMARQPFINPVVRAKLVNWMVEVQEEMKLVHETLYLAVKLLDLYLDRVADVRRDSLQLIASTAFLIASKYEDHQSIPLISDFVYLSENSFNRDQLMAMERRMLEVVGFDLGAPLSYRFLRRYARVSRTNMGTLTLARYVLETSLMFFDLCQISESKLAIACLLLAFRMKRVGDWSELHETLTGYTQAEVEPLMWALNNMIRQREAKYDRLDSVYEKYSDSQFFEVALISPLEVEEQQLEEVKVSTVEPIFKCFGG